MHTQLSKVKWVAAVILTMLVMTATAGLKESIQEELDANPFLKEQHLKIRVAEISGYVTLEVTEGNRAVRELIADGTDISAGVDLETLEKPSRETIATLNRTVGRIGKMPEVKEVVLKALVGTQQDKIEDQFGDIMGYLQTGTYEKALPLLEALAEKNVAQAQAVLGGMYLEGIGVPKDEVKAFDLLRKSAEQGDPMGQAGLAGIYGVGTMVVPKDEAKAIELLRKSAEQGFAASQYAVGIMYLSGEGETKDDAKAVEWFRKAAVQGYEPSFNSIAWILATCKDPQIRDAKEALSYAQKAYSRSPGNWNALDTLAAALAANGQYDPYNGAAAMQEKCISLLRENNAMSAETKEKLIANAEQRLNLYKNQKPYIEGESLDLGASEAIRPGGAENDSTLNANQFLPNAASNEGFSEAGAERIVVGSITNLESLDRNASLKFSEIVFSSSGDRFAYVINNNQASSLIVRNTASLAVQEKIAIGMGDINLLAWSPADDRIMCSGDGSFAVADLALHKATIVQSDQWSHYGNKLSWKTDSDVYVFCEGGSSTWAERFNLETLTSSRDIAPEGEDDRAYIQNPLAPRREIKGDSRAEKIAKLEAECFTSKHHIAKAISYGKGSFQTDKYLAIQNLDGSFTREVREINNGAALPVNSWTPSPDLQTIIILQWLPAVNGGGSQYSVLRACKMALRNPPQLDFTIRFAPDTDVLPKDRDDFHKTIQAKCPLIGQVYSAFVNPLTGRVVGPDRARPKGWVRSSRIGTTRTTLHVYWEGEVIAPGDVVTDIRGEQVLANIDASSGGGYVSLGEEKWFVLETASTNDANVEAEEAALAQAIKQGELDKIQLLAGAWRDENSLVTRSGDGALIVEFDNGEVDYGRWSIAGDVLTDVISERDGRTQDPPETHQYRILNLSGASFDSKGLEDGSEWHATKILEKETKTEASKGNVDQAVGSENTAEPSTPQKSIAADPVVAVSARFQVEQNYTEEREKGGGLKAALVGQDWSASASAQLSGIPKSVAFKRIKANIPKSPEYSLTKTELKAGTIEFEQPLSPGRKLGFVVQVSPISESTGESCSVSIRANFLGGMRSQKEDIILEFTRLLDVAGGLVR